jgi:predicted lipase
LLKFTYLYYIIPISHSFATKFFQISFLVTAVKEQITAKDVLKNAVTIPNLPASLPEGATTLEESNVEPPPGDYDALTQACYDSFANQTYGGTPQCFAGSPKIINLTAWAPAPSLPPPGQFPPASSCPPIICRTLPYLDMSCTAFGTDQNPTTATNPPQALGGLPFLQVQDNKTSGNAIVAWNDTSKEAIFLFQFTNDTRDWFADALAYKTDNFHKLLDQDFPAAAEITGASGDFQVHAGFYFQFESLLVEGGEAKLNLTTALNQLNGGQTPLFVAISGFSLGGALSELAAVWASYKWPRAHILVATQGAPKVGNDEFLIQYKATAGVAWRFQYNLDEVPTIPPLSGYRTTREPIWITRQGADGPFYVLLEPRPDIALGITTWYDHWCEALYIPVLRNASSVAVPNWVYAAPAASSG